MNNQTEDASSIRYFNIYINFFYLIFGNLGNIFKIAFFLQKPLRSLPCSVYILFSTFSDFITLNNLPVLQLFVHLYPKYHWIKVTVDWSNHRNETILLSYTMSTYDIVICKVRTYLHMFSTDLSLQMLLFASMNRFYSSYQRKKRQNNTHLFVRHFCNYSNAYKLCIVSSLISAIVSLQHVFNFTIDSASEGCIPHSQVLWAVWTSSIHCFLLPILMVIFGILTLRNIHYVTVFGGYIHRLQCHSRRRRKHRFLVMCSQCSRCQNSIQYQIEKQLTLMIIGEVCVTIVTLLPYGIYAFHHLLQSIQRKNIIDLKQPEWIILLMRMSIYFEPSCGFYIYLTTLTILRKRFCKMVIENLLAMYNCCRKRNKNLIN